MNLLSLQQVTKQVEQQVIFKNLTLTVAENDHMGINMSYNAGTLLIQLLLGTSQPTSGTIVRTERPLIASISTDGLYQSLTVKKYLQFFCQLANVAMPAADEWAEFSLTDLSNVRISKLTLGQRRRVTLIRMLLFQPALLIVQNPLAQLNNEEVELYVQAFQVIQHRGIATLVTSPYMEELLLLSTTIYRYQANLGLEKTDLKVDSAGATVNIQPQSVFKVACHSADKTVFFSPEEIDFIESINGISNIRIGDEYFPATATMAELTEKLTRFGFFRCHRSYLVNLQRVAELISYSKNSYTLILKGTTSAKLPLSRSKVAELQALLSL